MQPKAIARHLPQANINELHRSSEPFGPMTVRQLGIFLLLFFAEFGPQSFGVG